MSEAGPGILWTMVPMELVTEGMMPQVPACIEYRTEGRLLLVQPGANGTATVQRLLSTDPADFLDPRWQPGAVLAVGDCH